MSEKIKFFMSFRARLMLLLSAFLLLTIVLVLALDRWAQKRAAEEVSQQSEQVKTAVNKGFSDFAKAIGMAIKNLNFRTISLQANPGQRKSICLTP